MNNWLARGLLIVGVLSITAVTAASLRAAAPAATSAAYSGANNAKGESPLGNLVADALKEAAKADVALVQASVLEEKDLPASVATPETARVALASPAEPVVTVKVSGKQLLAALERSVSLAPRKNQGFLQVSGLAVVYDTNRPQNNRVVEVKVGTEALNPAKLYTVAMPESLARGGLGYFRFWDAKEAKPVTYAGGQRLSLLDALVARLKGGSSATMAKNRLKTK